MARTIQQIQTSITTTYLSAMTAIGAIVNLPWSRRNKQQLAINTFSTATAAFEQIMDAYTLDIENKISAASPQTGPWFQAQMLKFQFDATNPQILQFDTVNFAPYHANIDTDLQVIKYCSVVPGVLGTTTIKVAAQVGGFPADLDTTYSGALAADQSEALLLSIPGITANVQSGNSDKIYIDASIYYQGGYAAIISDTVVAAIQAYLAAIPFNGVVLLSDIERAIKAVPGVNDVVFNNVQARADGTSYGSGTNLVVAGSTIARRWSTISGFIVGETTSTHTLTDSLTFIAE